MLIFFLHCNDLACFKYWFYLVVFWSILAMNPIRPLNRIGIFVLKWEYVVTFQLKVFQHETHFWLCMCDFCLTNTELMRGVGRIVIYNERFVFGWLAPFRLLKLKKWTAITATRWNHWMECVCMFWNGCAEKSLK